MTDIAPAQHATVASTEDQLKQWTLHIVDCINARDLQTPLDLYAAPDYVYENTEDNGQVLHLNATEMLRLRDFYFSELSPLVVAEVLSTEVHMDWHAYHATVWVGLRVRNDARRVLSERMNTFSWKLANRGQAGERWIWWKEHTSARFVQGAGI